MRASVPVSLGATPSLAQSHAIAQAGGAVGAPPSVDATVTGSTVRLSVGAAVAALGARAARRSKAVRRAEKRFPVLSRSDPPVGTFPKMPESVHPGVGSVPMKMVRQGWPR
eukprot:Skav218552  [mRNA]  locus=scaffold2599:154752:157778:- [translate_table: standard]